MHEVTEMYSGSEAGSYLRLIDFVYHSTLVLRVIKKKKVASPGAYTREVRWGVTIGCYLSTLYQRYSVLK